MLGPRSQRNASDRRPILQNNVSISEQVYTVHRADSGISKTVSKMKPQRQLPDLSNVVESQARQTQLEQLGLDNR